MERLVFKQQIFNFPQKKIFLEHSRSFFFFFNFKLILLLFWIHMKSKSKREWSSLGCFCKIIGVSIIEIFISKLFLNLVNSDISFILKMNIKMQICWKIVFFYISLPIKILKNKIPTNCEWWFELNSAHRNRKVMSCRVTNTHIMLDFDFWNTISFFQFIRSIREIV